jgi:hypothetical protein
MFPISERIALLSRVHIGTTIPLLVLCLVPFFARMYIRIWPVWRFGIDDGFIVAGLVIPTASSTASPPNLVLDADITSPPSYAP